MGRLIWLSSEYRDAITKIYNLEQEIIRQRVVIEHLEKLVKPTPVIESLLKEFQDMILVEQPFPDNKIPESAYLTPGE